MKMYKIPVEWIMCGEIEVAAETEEDAMRLFKKNIDDIYLPKNGEYVDGSFQISCGNESEAMDYMRANSEETEEMTAKILSPMVIPF